MRRPISAITIGVYGLCTATMVPGAAAPGPSLSVVNAHARAYGTRRDTAVRIGRRLFTRAWSAQILRIYVDGAGSHQIAGIVLSGIKFHRPLSRARFLAEVGSIVASTFDAAPVEEVDLWCVVPLSVGRGAVVSGDLAQPTERTVFSVTVRRGDQSHDGGAIYWDAAWARSALHERSKGA